MLIINLYLIYLLIESIVVYLQYKTTKQIHSSPQIRQMPSFTFSFPVDLELWNDSYIYECYKNIQYSDYGHVSRTSWPLFIIEHNRLFRNCVKSFSNLTPNIYNKSIFQIELDQLLIFNNQDEILSFNETDIFKSINLDIKDDKFIGINFGIYPPKYKTYDYNTNDNNLDIILSIHVNSSFFRNENFILDNIFYMGSKNNYFSSLSLHSKQQVASGFEKWIPIYINFLKGKKL